MGEYTEPQILRSARVFRKKNHGRMLKDKEMRTNPQIAGFRTGTLAERQKISLQRGAFVISYPRGVEGGGKGEQLESRKKEGARRK